MLTGARARIARRAVARSAASAGTYSAGGYSFPIAVSDSYDPNDRATWQSYADLLGSIDHAFELGLIRVFIAPPAEVSRICGGDETTLACYVPNSNQLIIPGEVGPTGFPTEPAIVHEYGHHIANHRNDTPWSAFDYGGKYWSTYNDVCSLVRAGVLFPGNQGEHYADDPGESWAEGYAWSQGYRAVASWEYNRALLPDANDFAAIRTDVLKRWKRNTVRRFRGRLSRRKRKRTFRIPISLDGAVRIKLAGPRGTNFNLRLRKSGHTVKRTRRPGSRDSLRYRWCSTRRSKIVVQVVRKRGSGPFRLRLSWPG